MGINLDTLLPNLTPEKQEQVLSQLPNGEAKRYREEGYGLRTKSEPIKPEAVSLESEPTGQAPRPLPRPPPLPISPPPTTPVRAPPRERTRSARNHVLVIGVLAYPCIVVLSALVSLVVPPIGVLLITFSGAPLGAAITYHYLTKRKE